MNIKIWFTAYGSANSGTRYRIEWDGVNPGDFVDLTDPPLDPTDRGDTFFIPYTTTLAEDAQAGSNIFVFDDATHFENGDRIKIDGETIVLGGLSEGENVFTDCTPGADNTIKRLHVQGAVVYKMHESFLHEDIDFGSRHAIRYRIHTIHDGVPLAPAEAIAVRPTPPRTNDFATLWGILDSSQGIPQPGVNIRLEISDGDNFNPRTAETFMTGAILATTDSDGYWDLMIPRGVAHVGGDAWRLYVGEKTHTLRQIPDVDALCYLEVI